MEKMKMIHGLITLMQGFSVIHGDFNEGNFRFVGIVSMDDSAHVKFQMSMKSKRKCAANCLQDVDCNAVEICTQGMTCRFTVGNGPETPLNSSAVTCQRYILDNPCVHGYWDRIQRMCVEESVTSTTTGVSTSLVTNSETTGSAPVTSPMETTAMTTTAPTTTTATAPTTTTITTAPTTTTSTTTAPTITTSTTTAPTTTTSTTTAPTTTTSTTAAPTTTTYLTTTTETALTTTQGAVECFDCHCMLSIPGSKPSGKFILSNNKVALCILNTTTSHKWTVIQRRYHSGTQSFNLNWLEYEEGFGDLGSDFWIGNKYIHEMTTIYGNTHLRIELTSSVGHVGVIEYAFHIDNATEGYRLHVTNYTGTHGDAFSSADNLNERANGMKFTTRDRDNDLEGIRNCAILSDGGWWHNRCQRSNLNGVFGHSNYVYGLNWNKFMEITRVEMKIRRP